MTTKQQRLTHLIGVGLLAMATLTASCQSAKSDPGSGAQDSTLPTGDQQGDVGAPHTAAASNAGTMSAAAPGASVGGMGGGTGGPGVSANGGTGGGGASASGGTGGAATSPVVTVAGAPIVLYTDLVAGPTSGGENNKGTYLSLFGLNFGATGLGSAVKVFINNVEVASYRYLGPSRGRPDIQQLTVQVGAIGNPAPGVALPVKVTVNGVASNTNNTFTAQPGDILFVSTTGDDATAVKNDITHPWRHVQTPSEGGALGAMAPGDVLVLRGGPTVIWSDIGYDNRWLRFRRVTGSAPSGVKGTGYLSIVAYPGEDVHYVPPAGTSGGIHGMGEDFPEVSDWVVISGLHVESVAASRSDGAPINLQAHSDHWRVVNNDVGPWPASSTAADKAGGIVGNGKAVVVLGNHVHNIGGGTENHGMYLDSGSNDVEIGYNAIHDVTSGNLIQTYDNIGGYPLENIRVHHNVLYAGGRYGLNISAGTHSYRAWDNVISNTAFAAVRFAVKGDSALSFAILHNTIFDANLGNSGGAISNDDQLNAGSAIIRHNIVAADGVSPASSYYLDGSDGSAIAVERNLWFGRGAAPRQDVNPVGGSAGTFDPRFLNPGGRDFSLGTGSAAIDQATAAMPFPVGDDYRMKPRTSGARADIGAYEL